MDELRDFQDSASFDGHLCADVCYADDTTLIATVFEKLQFSTDQMLEIWHEDQRCKK